MSITMKALFPIRSFGGAAAIVACLIGCVAGCGGPTESRSAADSKESDAAQSDGASEVDAGSQAVTRPRGGPLARMAQPSSYTETRNVDALRADVLSPPSAIDWDNRMAAADRLGELADFATVDPLLDLMEDDDPQVRAAAAESLFRVLKLYVEFPADGPPDQRARVVEYLRALWAKAQRTGRVEDFRRRQQAKHGQ